MPKAEPILCLSLCPLQWKDFTPCPVQCPRGGRVCVEGARCDVSMVKITVETKTWVYLTINLVESVPPSFLYILCLTVSIFRVTQSTFKANFKCFFPSYYLGFHSNSPKMSHCLSSVLVKQSLQKQRHRKVEGGYVVGNGNLWLHMSLKVVHYVTLHAAL